MLESTKANVQETVLDNINEAQWALDEIFMYMDEGSNNTGKLETLNELFADSVIKIKMVRDQLLNY